MREFINFQNKMLAYKCIPYSNVSESKLQKQIFPTVMWVDLENSSLVFHKHPFEVNDGLFEGQRQC